MTTFERDHAAGDPDCPQCWGGNPFPCRECGGLVHYEWGYFARSACVVCGWDPHPKETPSFGIRPLFGPTAGRHPMIRGRLRGT